MRRAAGEKKKAPQKRGFPGTVRRNSHLAVASGAAARRNFASGRERTAKYAIGPGEIPTPQMRRAAGEKKKAPQKAGLSWYSPAKFSSRRRERLESKAEIRAMAGAVL